MIFDLEEIEHYVFLCIVSEQKEFFILINTYATHTKLARDILIST